MEMTWDQLDWHILDRLRDGFLTGAAARGPYWQSPDDLAHYNVTFAERIGWKWDHVLAELVRRGWSPPAGPVLDWGCGSGVAGRRVLAAWPELARGADASLHVFDHSLHAEAFAAQQARDTFAGLAVQSWDRNVNPTTVIVSHVLNELDADSTAELEEVIGTAECVLWIEPGTSPVARTLVEWRERLRDRFRFVYPCPHQGTCGLLAPGNERHWCHHFAAPPPGIFADSNWVKFGQRAGIDLRSLPYAALVMEKRARPNEAPLPADSGRIIGRPEVFKPYARLLGCDATGVAPLEWPRRADPRLIKRLDRANAPRLFRWTHQHGTLQNAEPLAPRGE